MTQHTAGAMRAAERINLCLRPCTPKEAIDVEKIYAGIIAEETHDADMLDFIEKVAQIESDIIDEMSNYDVLEFLDGLKNEAFALIKKVRG